MITQSLSQSASNNPRGGRPTKHYHPLLEKEKQLNKLVKDTLPSEVAKSVTAIGSSLAHLYGLPKTHKPQLSMQTVCHNTSYSTSVITNFSMIPIRWLLIVDSEITSSFSVRLLRICCFLLKLMRFKKN